MVLPLGDGGLRGLLAAWVIAQMLRASLLGPLSEVVPAGLCNDWVDYRSQ